MKNTLIYSFFIFTLFACKTNANKYNSAHLFHSNTEKLAKSKDFIDVDVKYFTDTVYTFGYKEIPSEDLRKIKAIVYRIYSNIDLKNNIYVLNIKNGADVYISEDVFDLYKNNIEKINQEAKIYSEKYASSNMMNLTSEEKMEIPPITKEYLNSLLID